jgi:hypothetical protein
VVVVVEATTATISTVNILIIVGAGGLGITIMMSLIFYFRERDRPGKGVSKVTVMKMLANCMRNTSIEIFDIVGDYVNYLLVASGCSDLKIIYMVFLGRKEH